MLEGARQEAERATPAGRGRRIGMSGVFEEADEESASIEEVMPTADRIGSPTADQGHAEKVVIEAHGTVKIGVR